MFELSGIEWLSSSDFRLSCVMFWTLSLGCCYYQVMYTYWSWWFDGHSEGKAKFDGHLCATRILFSLFGFNFLDPHGITWCGSAWALNFRILLVHWVLASIAKFFPRESMGRTYLLVLFWYFRRWTFFFFFFFYV